MSGLAAVFVGCQRLVGQHTARTIGIATQESSGQIAFSRRSAATSSVL
jgi:hypothetical protein